MYFLPLLLFYVKLPNVNLSIFYRCKFYLDVDQLHDFVQKVKADWRAAIPWYPLVPTAHKVMDEKVDIHENYVKLTRFLV